MAIEMDREPDRRPRPRIIESRVGSSTNEKRARQSSHRALTCQRGWAAPTRSRHARALGRCQGVGVAPRRAQLSGAVVDPRCRRSYKPTAADRVRAIERTASRGSAIGDQNVAQASGVRTSASEQNLATQGGRRKPLKAEGRPEVKGPGGARVGRRLFGCHSQAPSIPRRRERRPRTWPRRPAPRQLRPKVLKGSAKRNDS